MISNPVFRSSEKYPNQRTLNKSREGSFIFRFFSVLFYLLFTDPNPKAENRINPQTFVAMVNNHFCYFVNK